MLRCLFQMCSPLVHVYCIKYHSIAVTVFYAEFLANAAACLCVCVCVCVLTLNLTEYFFLQDRFYYCLLV